MAINKISEFPKVTPSAEDKILIEKNGEGGHINLSEMPVSTPVNTKITGEVNSLKSRIDNIMASSGDDISEIVDARQGSDGTNYASLRARLDAENSELKGDLSELYKHFEVSYNNVNEHYINVPIVAEHEYKISNKTGGVIGLASYNEDKRKLETFDNMPTGTEKVIKPTVNAYYLMVYFTSDGTVVIEDYSLKVPKLENGLKAIETDLKVVNDTIVNVAERVNLFNKDGEYVKDRLTSTTGSEQSNTGWGYVNIPVIGGKTLSVYAQNKRTMTCLYDTNGNVLTGGKDQSSVYNLVLPSNASVFRVSADLTTFPDIVVTYSEKPVKDYIEYNKCKPSENFDVYSRKETNDVVSDVTAKDREVILALLGQSIVELLDISKMVDGEYISYLNGNTDSLDTFTRTDYIPIYNGLKITVNGGSVSSQSAFYDEDYNFISGELSGKGDIHVPKDDRIKYLRWCCPLDNKNIASLRYTSLIASDTVVEVSDGESLLDGIHRAYEIGASKVIIHHGTYDVIEEYKSRYGNDYFDNYTNGYNGMINGYFDGGLWVDNLEMTFEAGSSVVAHYTGNNAYVKQYFSAFAVGSNATIEGLVLDASELRYGIHPDFHPNTKKETVIFRNCDLHHYKTTSNQAIGCGLGEHTLMIIEGCIFRSDGNNIVWRFHNNISSESKSKVIMKDCYFVGEGYAKFNSYSSSELMTDVLVSNCSWITPPVVGKETSDSNDNVQMIAWNNETRTN